jgi:hypothetical protein
MYNRIRLNSVYVASWQNQNAIFFAPGAMRRCFLGLRNSIRSFEYRNDVNKLMENVVYLHLRRKNYKVYVGKLGDKEIDFMAELNGERIYFQVTYMLFDQKTIDREFGNLMSINDHYPKYVISMDEVSAGSDFKGVRQLHLRDFLSEQ